jgi:hypothetical protein
MGRIDSHAVSPATADHQSQAERNVILRLLYEQAWAAPDRGRHRMSKFAWTVAIMIVQIRKAIF